MADLIDRDSVLALAKDIRVPTKDGEYRHRCIDPLDVMELPLAQPEKLYTKADYIMALHKEYGCSLTKAEEAHNRALEYLQEEMMMRGGKNERREREGLL